MASAGIVECNRADDDAASFLFVSPIPRQCASCDCQQTALECSTLCQYCHRLEGYLQWYRATRQQQRWLWPNNSFSRRLDGNADKDQSVSNNGEGHSPGLEPQHDTTGSNDSHASPEPTMDVVLNKDDPTGKLLSLRRNDSLVSLGRSDLSWVPSCFDDSASITTTISDLMDNELDQDGLWSSLSLDFEGWTDNWLSQELKLS
jgi:hypothetical protein